MSAGRPARSVLAGVLLTGLACAAVWSVAEGWADYRSREKTIAATEQAIALTRDNAADSVQLATLLSDRDTASVKTSLQRAVYLNPWDAGAWIDLGLRAERSVQLATLLSDRDTASVKTSLQRAVYLNPWDAGAWIDLGLRAERDGDNLTAENDLLRAAEVNLQYQPRWTLANFYSRHDEEVKFWTWTKKALAISYGDTAPLFRLCGQLEEKGGLMERLQIRSPSVRAQYLTYLLNQGRVDVIGPAVQLVEEDGRETDLPLLLTACDRYLDAVRVEDAQKLWAHLAQSHWVPGGPDSQTEEFPLVNGMFETAPTSRGFDWRMPGVEGIVITQEGNRRGLRIAFSGGEPEECEALTQLVPVHGGTNYLLTTKYRTQDIPANAGLSWRISDAVGTPQAKGADLAAEDEQDQRVEFKTPADCRLIRASVFYHRTSGTTRIEGFLDLRKVVIRRLAQAPIDGSRVRK